MADPFSLTAGAVSVIATAIQVCQALISYCNAWTSFDGDIGNTSEKLNGLRLTLEILKDIMPKLDSLDPSAAPMLENVTKRILSCNKGVDQLREALIKLQPIGSSSGLRQSLQNLKQQSLYPFRKDMLQGLRSTVIDMQANLDSAVQVLEL
ncbi:hypothetical protein MMC30_009113 [Trapelia coarctata]|nr:hypothetical protein [Trapelia coarctata]